MAWQVRALRDIGAWVESNGIRFEAGQWYFRGATLVMATPALIGFLFLAIAALFFVLALRDFMRGERTLAQRVRLRVGIIFTIVGVGLQLVHRLFVAP